MINACDDYNDPARFQMSVFDVSYVKNTLY